MKEVRDTYNALTGFSDTRGSLWEEQKHFTDFVRPGMTIVDAGCGNGRLLKLLEGVTCTYIGIDNSAKLLEKAQMSAKEFPEITSRFFEGSFLGIPLPDKTADIIFCIAALHHIPSERLQVQALREFKRVLKPGGKLCMTNWYLSAQTKYMRAQMKLRIIHPRMYAGFGFRDFLIPWHTKEKIYYRYYYAFSPHQLKSRLQDAGFQHIRNKISHGARDWSGMRTKRNIISVAEA